jgi:anti-sigma B factor antagonist
MEFGLTVDESKAPFTVVAVAGEVDLVTAPELRAALLELVGAGKVALIVDLEAVEFLDSTGLGVLVGAVKRARADGGDLSLVCTHPHLLKVFEITGLTTVFAIHDSLSEALATPL